jgi:hypothetical protein
VQEIKGTQIHKEEVKLSLFADDVILYLKDLTNSTIKLFEIINSFDKVAGYKINIQKSVALPIMNRLRKKFGKHPFHNSLKIIKYLGIHLIKETKDRLNEIYK